MLVSGEPAARLRITALIAHLDTPVADGGDTQVRYLRYADAEKIATKLKEQITGHRGGQRRRWRGGGRRGRGSAGPAADRNATIWAEPETNALVITASPKTMRSLKSIIDQLDIRRAQVLVEAIIVDVSTNKSADLGVNWAVFSRRTGHATCRPAASSARWRGTSIVDSRRASPTQNRRPCAPTRRDVRHRPHARQRRQLRRDDPRAAQRDDNTNVIATPSATTLDNQEAELKVAQEVPFITGQYTNTGNGGNNGTVNPFTTVQRQEVGTILKITPQINDGDGGAC